MLLKIFLSKKKSTYVRRKVEGMRTKLTKKKFLFDLYSNYSRLHDNNSRGAHFLMELSFAESADFKESSVASSFKESSVTLLEDLIIVSLKELSSRISD